MNPLPPALTYLCATLACELLLLLLFAATSADARINVRSVRQSLSISQELSIPASPRRRRLLALRRSETPDGVRLTLVSDAPLDDYRSYVEGERFFIHIPQAALISTQKNPQGRGFADMQIEQRGTEVQNHTPFLGETHVGRERCGPAFRPELVDPDQRCRGQ